MQEPENSILFVAVNSLLLNSTKVVFIRISGDLRMPVKLWKIKALERRIIIFSGIEFLIFKGTHHLHLFVAQPFYSLKEVFVLFYFSGR